MRSFSVVFDPPLFNNYLRLLQGIKDFSIQAFIPQLAVEALAIAVLPRASALDVKCSRPELTQPLAQLLRQKFWTIAPRERLQYSEGGWSAVGLLKGA